MHGSPSKKTSGATLERWRLKIGAIPVTLLLPSDSWSQLTPCVPKVRVSTDSTHKTIFCQATSARLSTKCWGSTWTKSQSQCCLDVFPRQLGGGSESRIPTLPAQGGGRRVVAGLCQRHPFGMEGSASLLLSGLCRLCARALPRKNCHVRVSSPRVHTRNKTQHPQTHTRSHPHSSSPLPSSSSTLPSPPLLPTTTTTRRSCTSTRCPVAQGDLFRA